MQHPHALPLELHKEIIDLVGRELLEVENSKFEFERKMATLCKLSLVCKEWHYLAIRHIFRQLDLLLHWRKLKARGERGFDNNKRLAALRALLKADREIAHCVEIVLLQLPLALPSTTWSMREENSLVEWVCREVAPVRCLKLNFQTLFPMGSHDDFSLKGYPQLLRAVRYLTGT